MLGVLSGQKSQIADEDLDEEDAVRKHKKFFADEDEDGNEADSGSLGTAAAMQALKLFSSGQAVPEEGAGAGAGAEAGMGKAQSHGTFMALAMSEATKVGFSPVTPWTFLLPL